MDPNTFYSTVSTLCFTLLGFWWAVVQFRHDDWMDNPDRRRMAYAVSLHFMLPGIMALLSLVVAQSEWLWRAVFIVAGITGIVGVIFVVRSSGNQPGSLRPALVGQWIGLPVYALVVLFALIPDLPDLLGLGMAPLEVEGIFLALIVVLGANVAWLLFSEPRGRSSTSDGA